MVDSEAKGETPKSAVDIAYQASVASEPQKSKNRNHVRRSVIGGLIGASVIACLQWFAPSFDHQVANMISMAVGAGTALFVIYQLQRWAGNHGHRLAAAGVLILGIAGLSVMFQFEGFSGEMLPQFKTRFGSPPPELRSLTDTAASAGSTDSAVEASEAGSPTVVAEVDSTGFLGSQRTGVIASRSFDVSAIESEMKVLWNQGIGEGWASFAVSADRAVTLEQRDELECVTCYRLADGELLWMKSHEARHEHPLGGIGPRSTPTISGDRVYAQGATGRVWCLDLQTGETFWSVDLLDLAGWDQVTSEMAITWGRATSPLIVDGLCILPYGGPDRKSRNRSEFDCL